MKKSLITFMLLLSFMSLYAQKTAQCAQLPMPDILAKMIIETISLDKYSSDADCYYIIFREDCASTEPSDPGQSHETGYPTEELINQLETNSRGDILYWDSSENDSGKQFRHFMRKNGVKLPAQVVRLYISSSPDGEVSILCVPMRYVRHRRIWVSSDLTNEHIWTYDATSRRYNLERIDNDYPERTVSVDATQSFYDILQ